MFYLQHTKGIMNTERCMRAKPISAWTPSTICIYVCMCKYASVAAAFELSHARCYVCQQIDWQLLLKAADQREYLCQA